MPDHKCTETENIKDIKESIKDLVSEFRDVMTELRSVLQDGREYRTRIDGNDKAIQELKEADTIQWEKISTLGKRIDTIDIWVAKEEGARKVIAYIPTAITVILSVIVLWDKIFP